MRRALALWIAAWVVIGAIDVVLSTHKGTPDWFLVYAIAVDLTFAVVGGFVMVSDRVVEHVSERTLTVSMLAAAVVAGAGIILLAGVRLVVFGLLGITALFLALTFAAIRLAPAVLSGRRRRGRPGADDAQRNAKRDAVFAIAADQARRRASQAKEDDHGVT